MNKKTKGSIFASVLGVVVALSLISFFVLKNNVAQSKVVEEQSEIFYGSGNPAPYLGVIGN